MVDQLAIPIMDIFETVQVTKKEKKLKAMAEIQVTSVGNIDVTASLQPRALHSTWVYLKGYEYIWIYFKVSQLMGSRLVKHWVLGAILSDNLSCNARDS